MKIVGVTACPVGISHTYLAQEALMRECSKRGYENHFETQGSIGIENEIPTKKILEADLVIFATSVAVEGEERFDGKLIYHASVFKAINNPSNEIDKAIEFYEKNLQKGD